MGKKRRRKKGRRSKKPKARQGGGRAAPTEPVDVEAGLAQGRHAEALRKAMALCEERPSDRARDLRLRAFLARADELIRRGREEEAAALVDTAAELHPEERGRVMRRRDYLLARRGEVDALLAPLAVGERGAEAELARWVVDPAHVAGCGALGADHPVRSAAAEVSEALEAVTSRETEPELVALQSVPRRSPLAGWKMIVRAIDAFHRGDDASCRRALGAVDDETPPGAIKAALVDMMEHREQAGQEGRELACAVSGGEGDLRARLEALDAAVRTGRRRKVLAEIREATRACERERPELLEELRQRIGVACALLAYSVKDVTRAMGGRSRKDAGFWRLLARQHELVALEKGDVGALMRACACWEEMVGHAAAEGLVDGPGEAALHLHVASLLTDPPLELLEQGRPAFERRFHGLGAYYKDQDEEVLAAASRNKDTDFLYPEKMFDRAARAHPSAEVFEQWLGWARTLSHFRRADEAAQAWHEALPRDVRPLLYLAESAERRNALKKALKYVARAEEIEGMRSDVRRARTRLVVATLVRHARAGKPHLARKDVEALAALPGMDDERGRAFVAAASWAAGLHEGDEARAEGLAAQAARLLGDPIEAEVLLEIVAHALGSGDRRPRAAIIANPGGLWPAAARACALCERVQLAVKLPAPLARRLTIEQVPAGGLETEGLEALCRAALASRERTAAFLASGAGLAPGRGEPGRFLLARSRALDGSQWYRNMMCIRACLALARSAGDAELERETRQTYRDRAGRAMGFLAGRMGEPAPLSMELVEQVLEFERQSASPRSSPPERLLSAVLGEEDEEPCNCPECRARREARASGRAFADEDDEEFDEELDEELFEIVQEFMATMAGPRKRGRRR